ncbi:hypothetical protein [Kangiella shandongensis]|uniref:hypothetical protein n=1 Tax=Kangiella shandongensis TaxID=2763258 RepID=UPI001CBC5F47|nr:hypothetical protein [Kangiella shandongensis]
MKSKTEQRLDEMVQTMQRQQASEQNTEQVQLNLINAIEAEAGRTNEISPGQKLGQWFKSNFIKSPLKIVGSMGAAASFALVLFLFSASPQVSFASMASKLKQVSNFFYEATMTNAGMHLMDIRVYYRSSGELRMESYSLDNTQTPSFINIMNIGEGRGVMKLPASGESVPFSFEPNATAQSVQEDPLYWRKLILNVDPESAEPIGTKNISGTELTGYLIEQESIKTEVWVQPDSQLPMAISVTQYLESGDIGFEMKADVLYNQSFDDSLFDLN